MTTQQLKFIKVETVPASGLTTGAIYFETSTHLLKVATSATATEVYSGVRSASYNTTTKVLSIVNEAGTSISIDLSDVASANDITSKLSLKANSSITITGTGVLSGGGNLTANRTITHNQSSIGSKSTGLYKIGTDEYGHVTSATEVVKSDITNLGIPASNTTYSAATDGGLTLSGTAFSLNKAADTTLGGIKTGYTVPSTDTGQAAKKYAVQLDANDKAFVAVPWTDTNTNTTYTFTNGTNGFTVTPSGGTAQTVTVTPSITNNVLKTTAATTAGYIPKFSDTSGTIADGYTVALSSTTAPTTNKDTYLTTVGYLDKSIEDKFKANDAMLFKGTLGTGGTVTALPTNNYQAGWTYKVITAGTYASISCEVGDLIIAIKDGPASGTTVVAADWTVVQGNLDGTVTGPESSVLNHVAIFADTSGKVIKDSSFTIGKSVPSTAVFTDSSTTKAGHYTPEEATDDVTTTTAGTAPGWGGSVVTGVKRDTKGHIIGVTTGALPTQPVTPTTITGNAGSATKLQTARSIDGISFDGSANITHYGKCDTAAATAAKVVTLASFTLAEGARVAVKFTNTNTAANPTLNVNSTGAKAIKYAGAAITAGYLVANKIQEFIYDGTDYILVGDINTTYTAASLSALTDVTLSSSTLSVTNNTKSGTTKTVVVDLYWEEF